MSSVAEANSDKTTGKSFSTTVVRFTERLNGRILTK